MSLAILKADDELPRIPIVVLSSSDREDGHSELLPTRCKLLHRQALDLQGLRNVVSEDRGILGSNTATLPPHLGHTMGTRIG